MQGHEDRSKFWDVLMMVLLVGSVALVFVYEALDPARFASTRTLLLWVDLGLVVFFAAEWLFRVQASGRAGRYAVRNSWELLGMIPLLLPVPAGLRALRLLRVVRILRVFKTVGQKLGVWQRIAKEGHLKPIGVTSAGITVAGATLVWLLERDTHAELHSWTEALWWSIVTVTTVGYGDITPESGAGRLVAGLLMITGIGVIGLLASTLASALVTDKETDETASGVVAALDRLAQMRDSGHLDDDEFAAAKAKILQ